MSRIINETYNNNNNKIKYYLAKVETVDENYIITFSIPKILENIKKYPTAYPKNTDHVKEVKVGDSILVEQLDISLQFFTYAPLNKNSNTGIYFGDVMIDISDGKTININTPNVKMTFDSEDNKIFIGNDNYSLNQWIADLNVALSQLTTIGNKTTQNGKVWYNGMLLDKFNKIMNIFKT